VTGGRTLDTTRDPDIRRAALELLAEEGYDRLTIEAVAARAKAGKATLYRRWASKAELVIDALKEMKPSGGPLPDTGTLAGDLHAFFGRVASAENSHFPLVCGLAPALIRDPELAVAFQEKFVGPRVAQLEMLLNRARQRGEVAPGRNSEMFRALFPALMLHRIVFTGRQPDEAYVDAIVDQVLVPLASARVPMKGART
jgi:AcrR family transcriptional regulator